MGHIVTRSGKLRETGHLKMRPERNGKTPERGFYNYKSHFVALHTDGVQHAEHVTAWQISKFKPVILAPGPHVIERKRGGCIYGR